MYTGTYFQGYDRTEKKGSVALTQNNCYLRVSVDKNALCQFSYSLDGETFQPIGARFKATPGTWIGAKVSLFALNPNITTGRRLR